VANFPTGSPLIKLINQASFGLKERKEYVLLFDDENDFLITFPTGLFGTEIKDDIFDKRSLFKLILKVT
jgi:hypothetical protein